jgi:hypothetical protein
MVFMKAFVSLAVAAVMATSGDAAISATDLNASEKTRFCSAIISDSAYRKEANTVCDKYKYTLPRPRVYNACRFGEGKGGGGGGGRGRGGGGERGVEYVAPHRGG